MDVVVTVPQAQWQAWLREGDLAGGGPARYRSHFWIAAHGLPAIEPGERVYIVAHNRLRGYAPLVGVEHRCQLRRGSACLMREGGAAAVERFIRLHPYAYDRTRIERGSYERNLADAVYARDPWLTAVQAAHELGVSPATVQAHLRRGWLAGKRVQRTGNHGTWYLRRAELARFRLRRQPASGSLGNPDWGAGQWHRRRRAGAAGTVEVTE